MVVLGSEMLVRLSHEHTGAAFGKSGFGGASAARTKMIATENATAKIIRE
jgi:hypothetical protein